MTTCNNCGADRTRQSEAARVRSNIRQFQHEHFEVWRCAGCQSIHASEEVDLPHYYSGYPIFGASLDWKLNVVYKNLLKRLKAAGLRKEHRILDYGCGNGLFVEYLQSQGYQHAIGFDRFQSRYCDESLLRERYDCIVSQDVIEHVDSPIELLELFNGLVEGQGVIGIGTPDAAALSLQEPEDFVHALHQPYHRHIVSASALRRCGERMGWSVVKYYPTMYNNTLFPTMNPRFVLHYVRCFDNVFDMVAEPIRMNSWKLWTPTTLFFALFGYFFDRHTDVMFTFRANPR